MTGENQHRNFFSIVSILICGILMILCTVVFYPRYKKAADNATLAWDAAGYYLYLPSIFIYHDLPTLDKTNKVIEKYQPGPANIQDFVLTSDNGHPVIKYSSGMAVAELPFFLIAHALAKPLGYPADGFSMPYQAAIQFGALLISFLGL
ncbi:MAG: hypothetical protein ABI378_11755, partial [Chitinophagaceae bacterium]